MPQQYFLTVNLDKKEFLDPLKLGNLLTFQNQLYYVNDGGIVQAIFILLVSDKEILEINSNYIGRWAGDRIIVVGDFEERNKKIYEECREGKYVDITDNMIPLMVKLFQVIYKSLAPELETRKREKKGNLYEN